MFTENDLVMFNIFNYYLLNLYTYLHVFYYIQYIPLDSIKGPVSRI